MNIETPTTAQVADNLVAQLQISLNQTIPLLPKSFIYVLARATAGIFIILYKYAGFNLLQQFARYASFQETQVGTIKLRPLVELGRQIGVGDPLNAVNAQLTIQITVTNQTGSIPANTQLQSGAGVTYLTLTAVALSAATVSVNVRAVQDQSGLGGGGTVGNLANGSVLNFVNPQSNVMPSTTVTATVVTGVDAETETSYRQRVIDRFQKRPQGGALADWEMWANEVADVKNAYPYTDTPGAVGVYIESETLPDGIADSTLIAAVEAHLETVRPASAYPKGFAISRQSFNVDIVGLVVDDFPSVSSQISAALSEYFLSREPYIVGLTLPPRKDRVTDSEVGAVVSQIVTLNNGVFYDAILKVGTTPQTVYTLLQGQKAKLGTVTYI